MLFYIILMGHVVDVKSSKIDKIDKTESESSLLSEQTKKSFGYVTS